MPFVSFVGTPAFSFAHESHQSHECLSRLTLGFFEVRRPNQAAPVNTPVASSWATSVVEVLGLVILEVSKTEREMTLRKSRLCWLCRFLFPEFHLESEAASNRSER